MDFLQDDVTGVSGSGRDWWIGQWKGSAYRDDPAAYSQCFARLVWSMRAAGGGWWKFVWNPDAGQPNPDAMYPGDRVVDIVALDAYDVAGWSWVRGGTIGLDSWLKPFAAAHRKQVAIPEPAGCHRVPGMTLALALLADLGGHEA